MKPHNFLLDHEPLFRTLELIKYFRNDKLSPYPLSVTLPATFTNEGLIQVSASEENNNL